PVWSPPAPVSADTGSASYVDVVVDDGRLIAVWESNTSVVRSATSDDGGRTWSEPVAVSTSGLFVSRPKIVAHDDGVTVVWGQLEPALDPGLQWSVWAAT